MGQFFCVKVYEDFLIARVIQLAKTFVESIDDDDFRYAGVKL